MSTKSYKHLTLATTSNWRSSFCSSINLWNNQKQRYCYQTKLNGSIFRNTNRHFYLKYSNNHKNALKRLYFIYYFMGPASKKQKPCIKSYHTTKYTICSNKRVKLGFLNGKFNIFDHLYLQMSSVKVYREKLLKIKKQMQNIYQRTKTLKVRKWFSSGELL